MRARSTGCSSARAPTSRNRDRQLARVVRAPPRAHAAAPEHRAARTGAAAPTADQRAAGARVPARLGARVARLVAIDVDPTPSPLVTARRAPRPYRRRGRQDQRKTSAGPPCVVRKKNRVAWQGPGRGRHGRLGEQIADAVDNTAPRARAQQCGGASSGRFGQPSDGGEGNGNGRTLKTGSYATNLSQAKRSFWSLASQRSITTSDTRFPWRRTASRSGT